MELKKFFHAFFFAGQGFKFAFIKERNFKFHLAVTFVVIFLSVYFSLSAIEWLFVIVSIGSVLAAELMNTAIEEVCNLLNRKLKLKFHDTWHPRNLAAASVLVTAIFAALVGLIIFLPKLLSL